ncbi:uncharacterized protein LOC131207429 [Anopheles bellator]|uniref:uncharacterized protein LOC131207429 n=1 Tax=Anopheles bellator TaxID=139047 RepID=UPI002648BFFC|nr:uncharacterized protein LOC131207429 [Anopheles bellator]
MCWNLSTLLVVVHCLAMAHLLGFQLGKPWPVCPVNDNRLLSLFNLLCNTTQRTTITARDACYGCFFRAGSLTAGPAQLSAISQCATLYLLNSSYAVCATNLAGVVTGSRPLAIPAAGNIDCYTGHCEFVQCVRRINGNMLINDCILQTLVNRDLNVEAQRTGFYLNTTSCILARVRCDPYNPITGQLQNVVNTPGGTVRTTRTASNALQISSTGDIRVVSFPSKVLIGDAFCSSRTPLDQSSFGNSIC